MIVYHGSKEKFDIFNYSKIGKNGTNEGKGFYFTDSKNIAMGYGENGYLYTVEFNGKNPLSNDEITITRDQLAKYLLELNKSTDYLSNWGDISSDGLENVLTIAITGELEGSSNDVELMAGICNASGNMEIGLNLTYELLGYDSIIVEDAEWGGNQKIYVALVNDIIKIKNIESIKQKE